MDAANGPLPELFIQEDQKTATGRTGQDSVQLFSSWESHKYYSQNCDINDCNLQSYQDVNLVLMKVFVKFVNDSLRLKYNESKIALFSQQNEWNKDNCEDQIPEIQIENPNDDLEVTEKEILTIIENFNLLNGERCKCEETFNQFYLTAFYGDKFNYICMSHSITYRFAQFIIDGKIYKIEDKEDQLSNCTLEHDFNNYSFSSTLPNDINDDQNDNPPNQDNNSTMPNSNNAQQNQMSLNLSMKQYKQFFEDVLYQLKYFGIQRAIQELTNIPTVVIMLKSLGKLLTTQFGIRQVRLGISQIVANKIREALGVFNWTHQDKYYEVKYVYDKQRVFSTQIKIGNDSFDFIKKGSYTYEWVKRPELITQAPSQNLKEIQEVILDDMSGNDKLSRNEESISYQRRLEEDTINRDREKLQQSIDDLSFRKQQLINIYMQDQDDLIPEGIALENCIQNLKLACKGLQEIKPKEPSNMKKTIELLTEFKTIQDDITSLQIKLQYLSFQKPIIQEPQSQVESMQPIQPLDDNLKTQSSELYDLKQALSSAIEQYQERYDLPDHSFKEEHEILSLEYDEYLTNGNKKEAQRLHSQMKQLISLHFLSKKIEQKKQDIAEEAFMIKRLEEELTNSIAKWNELYYPFDKIESVSEEVQSMKDQIEQLGLGERMKMLEYLMPRLHLLENIKKIQDQLEPLQRDEIKKKRISQLKEIIKEGLETLGVRNITLLQEELNAEIIKLSNSADMTKQKDKIEQNINIINKTIHASLELQGLEFQPQYSYEQNIMAKYSLHDKEDYLQKSSQEEQKSGSEEEDQIKVDQSKYVDTKEQAVDDIKQMIKLLKSMPDCLENQIQQLIYFYKLIIFEINDEVYKMSSEQVREEVEILLTGLEARYHNEQFTSIIALQLIKGLQNSTSHDMRLKQLKILMKEIRCFNFQEFFDLTAVNEEQSKKIKDQVIYLLLGNTGCGKSTTVEYLLGRQMELMKIGKLNHIEAVKIFNEDLSKARDKVKSSYKAKPETRYVTPLVVNLRNLGKKKDQYLTIVDSPGSEDTESPEVDISTSLGIFKAISIASGVVPIIIFSYKNFGGRGEKLMKQIILYSGMIKSIEDYISSFVYFFTHVPNGEDEQVLAQLKSIKKFQTKNNSDESIIYFLRDMIKKAKSNHIQILRPLDNNPLSVFESIENQKPIQYPSTVFKQTIVDKSAKMIKEQFSLHEKCIVSAVRRGDADIASYKFEEMLEFTQLFKDDQFYQNKFNDTLKQIHNVIEDNFSRILERIEKCLSLNYTLSEEDINKVKAALNLAVKLDPIRNQFLKNTDYNTHQSDDIIASTIQIGQLIFDDVKKESIVSQLWPQFLDITQLMATSLGSKQLEILNADSTNQFWSKVDDLIKTTTNSIESIDYKAYNVNPLVWKSMIMNQMNDEDNGLKIVISGTAQRNLQKVEHQDATAFKELTLAINKSNNGKNKEKLTQLKENLYKKLEIALKKIFDSAVSQIMQMNVDTLDFWCT